MTPQMEAKFHLFADKIWRQQKADGMTSGEQNIKLLSGKERKYRLYFYEGKAVSAERLYPECTLSEWHGRADHSSITQTLLADDNDMIAELKQRSQPRFKAFPSAFLGGTQSANADRYHRSNIEDIDGDSSQWPRTSQQWLSKVSKPVSTNNRALTALIDLDGLVINGDRTSKFNRAFTYSCHGQTLTWYYDPKALEFFRRIQCLGHKLCVVTTASYFFERVNALFRLVGIKLPAGNYFNQTTMLQHVIRDKARLIERLGFGANALLFDDVTENFPIQAHFQWVKAEQEFPVPTLSSLPSTVGAWKQCAKLEPSDQNPALSLVIDIKTLIKLHTRQGRFHALCQGTTLNASSVYLDVTTLNKLIEFTARGHWLFIVNSDMASVTNRGLKKFLHAIGLPVGSEQIVRRSFKHKGQAALVECYQSIATSMDCMIVADSANLRLSNCHFQLSDSRFFPEIGTEKSQRGQAESIRKLTYRRDVKKSDASRDNALKSLQKRGPWK